MTKLAIALLLGTLTVTACGSPVAGAHPLSGTRTRAQLHAAPNVVNVQAAQAEIASDSQLVVIDVRNPDEFATGHIAQAALHPLPDLQTWSKTLDPKAHTLCVCRSGHRSGIAASQLTAMGFTNVDTMDGGMMAWVAAGYPTTTTLGRPHASGRAVTAEDAYAELSSDPKLVLIDVRNPDEFPAGHIAQSVNHPAVQVGVWGKTLDPSAHTLCVDQTGIRGNITAAKLASMGFTNVEYMSGGLNAWVAAGYKLVTRY